MQMQDHSAPSLEKDRERELQQIGLTKKVLFVRNTQESRKPKGETTKEIRRERHLQACCQEQMGKHPGAERPFSERGLGWGKQAGEGAQKEQAQWGEGSGPGVIAWPG